MRAEPNGFRVHRLNHSATTARRTAMNIRWEISLPSKLYNYGQVLVGYYSTEIKILAKELTIFVHCVSLTTKLNGM